MSFEPWTVIAQLDSMGLYSKSHVERNPPKKQHTLSIDLEDMMKGSGQSSPQRASITPSSISNTPPTTPLTPGTPLSGPGTPIIPTGSPSIASQSPLGPPTTPSYPGPYRHRLPSFTESDSQSSTRDTLSDDAASPSDSQSDVASVGSGSTAEWVNFDITPLVKKELKDAIITRRKTRGLPDVRVDFTPRLPDKLTPEEEERRRLQKERNRDAASKCRSKKRDAVGRLVHEAQELETENTKLREEMKALETERSQLQFLLDMHSSKCMMQQASPPITNPSSNIQITDSTGETISAPPLIQDTDETTIHDLHALGEALVIRAKTEATTPMTESPSSYGSSCFPPTPSTTHSHSCTEPSTPATPTSVNMDAPVFPTLSLSSIQVTTVVDHTFQETCTSGSPIASLASSPTMITDAFTMPDIADFHPVVPPTPELLDDTDPFSESFVKQYLGGDPLLSSDFSLPNIADNSTIPDSYLSTKSASADVSMTDAECTAESGQILPSTWRSISGDGYTEHQQPLLDIHFPQGEAGEINLASSRVNNPTRDTSETLSLSSLLGVSLGDLDGTMDDTSPISIPSNIVQ
ncbi:transcription factor kayak-like [Lytechinus variegatus]|uniref:transcription factor kayak-like n=1 Tax=Lytechinus variegatus TaxID=7654 RepID=UPI001BB12367|nr:transcription factor kayak-like [Lytechinus variegatus]